MMALNASTPNMPRLLKVKVPPAYSSGLRRPFRAARTTRWTSRASSTRPFPLQSRTTGVSSPSSTATAMATSTVGLIRRPSSV